MSAAGPPAQPTRIASRGWRDDRLGGLALLALGIPFFAVWLDPITGGCRDADACDPLPVFQIAIRGIVFLSLFWMPVLAVLAFRSRKAVVVLAAAAVSLTLLTALMTSPVQTILAPLGLADSPIFPQFGIAFGVVSLLSLADLARGR